MTDLPMSDPVTDAPMRPALVLRARSLEVVEIPTASGPLPMLSLLTPELAAQTSMYLTPATCRRLVDDLSPYAELPALATDNPNGAQPTP